MLTINAILLTVLCLASGPPRTANGENVVLSVRNRATNGSDLYSGAEAPRWAASHTWGAEILPMAIVWGEETLSGRPPEMRLRNLRFMSKGIPRVPDDAAPFRPNRRSSILNWVPSFESTADFSTLLGRFQI